MIVTSAFDYRRLPDPHCFFYAARHCLPPFVFVTLLILIFDAFSDLRQPPCYAIYALFTPLRLYLIIAVEENRDGNRTGERNIALRRRFRRDYRLRLFSLFFDAARHFSLLRCRRASISIFIFRRRHAMPLTLFTRLRAVDVTMLLLFA